MASIMKVTPRTKSVLTVMWGEQLSGKRSKEWGLLIKWVKHPNYNRIILLSLGSWRSFLVWITFLAPEKSALPVTIDLVVAGSIWGFLIFGSSESIGYMRVAGIGWSCITDISGPLAPVECAASTNAFFPPHLPWRAHFFFYSFLFL